MSKTASVSGQVILQSAKQLLGIPYIYLTHLFHLPSGDNYRGRGRYQLPFEGEWTVINGGVRKEFSHSWGIPTQRYAYDFVIMDKNGKTYEHEQSDKNFYYCYGKDIVAPADGTVEEIGDGCEDSVPFTEGDVMQFTAKDIRGNYILIRHAPREYSFIGHIKPGSIKVRAGQAVRRGEVIAGCGNSGNTTEPHVHFHLQDGKGFFTSAGLPVTFEDICAVRQENYAEYDSRPAPGVIAPEGQVRQISRGQRVKNGHIC